MILNRYLATVVLALLAMPLTAQTNADWAKFGRYEQANRDIQTAVRAVFMGDSITDHWAQYDPGFFSANDFLGRGISGQTTSEMLVRFRQDVIDLHPAVVLIMAGTNDIAQNNGFIKPENPLGNISSMCELARANGIEVILWSIPPVSRFAWRPEIDPAQKVVELNEMIRKYAVDNGICYLDYYRHLADDGGGIPEKWSHDTCHPNAECYRTVMEPLALNAVNAVLNDKK
ncbi:MAG: acylhydrolase [Alistipes sp.]|nr:acylhydrolase [Alistipes sp.]